MGDIINAQRAQVYLELADEMDKTDNVFLSQDLREMADALKPSEDRWLRSLPLVIATMKPDHFDAALYQLRFALKLERDAVHKEMLEYSQGAAAHIVAWRKSLPVSESKGEHSINPEASDRMLLRYAVSRILAADSYIEMPVSGSVTDNLMGAEAALRLLWEQYRERG